MYTDIPYAAQRLLKLGSNLPDNKELSSIYNFLFNLIKEKGLSNFTKISRQRL